MSREGRRPVVISLGHVRLRGAVLSVAGMLLAATMSATAGPAAAASASGSALPGPPLFMPLSSDTPFTADANEKVLISGTFRFQAGESRRVFGRLETTSTTAAEVELEAAVRCLDDSRDQQQSGISAWTARNHVGTGPLVLSPSLLFTAPTAGTYTCQLIAQTGIPNKGGNHLTAVADGTWLQVSSSDEVGAQWWQNPDCDSEGTEPTCSYVGGSAGQELWIFQNDGTPWGLWAAAPNATAASMSATVELTTCYRHTASCTDNHEGGSDGSEVSTHLELVQLGPGLGICRVNKTPDMTYAISGGAHHYSIHYELGNVPISATCSGSRLFAVFVYMKHVSGNPVKIDGTRPGGTEPESYTNAFVINSAFGTPASVPYVIGSSEATARNSIVAAGLVVGSVSYIVNSAPAGTVIVQNAPGGTVEPAGSPVNMTVSLGAVTVPDVVGSDKSSAMSQITASGLVAHVSVQKKCIDPGAVLYQDPPGGVVVAPASIVHITVDGGTFRTCTIK